MVLLTILVGKNGAWMFPYRNVMGEDGKKDDTKHIPGKKINKTKYNKHDKHPCEERGDNALGLTMTKANAIFLCDGGMELPGKVATALEGQTMKKTFEKPRSVADTLLHEILHLIQDRKSDGPVLTRWSSAVPDTQNS